MERINECVVLKPLNNLLVIILKTKNIFENKSANQIDLFSEEENSQNNIINEICNFRRLSQREP